MKIAIYAQQYLENYRKVLTNLYINFLPTDQVYVEENFPLRAAGEKIRTGILEHFSRMPAEDVQVWITSRENREALFSGEGMEAVW